MCHYVNPGAPCPFLWATLLVTAQGTVPAGSPCDSSEDEVAIHGAESAPCIGVCGCASLTAYVSQPDDFKALKVTARPKPCCLLILDHLFM